MVPIELSSNIVLMYIGAAFAIFANVPFSQKCSSKFDNILSSYLQILPFNWNTFQSLNSLFAINNSIFFGCINQKLKKTLDPSALLDRCQLLHRCFFNFGKNGKHYLTWPALGCMEGVLIL